MLTSRRSILTAIGFSLLAPLAPAMAKDKQEYNDCTKWEPGRIWTTGKSCQEKGKVRQAFTAHMCHAKM